MSIDYTDDTIYTLAYQIDHPEVIVAFAQTCAEQALDELIRAGVNPRRKTTETIIGRASREAASDITYFQDRESAVATRDHLRFYRESYIIAFLTHFRTESVIQSVEEKHKGRGFIIVCYR